jgi:hypothetical protein
MAFKKNPPKRNIITATLRAMKPKTDLLLMAVNSDSLKSVASRLSVGGRRYQTAREGKAVRVWRLT